MQIGFVGPGGPAPYTSPLAAPAPAGTQALQGAGGAMDAAAGAGEAGGAPMDPAIAEERAVAKVMEDQFNTDCQTCKNRKYQDGSDDPGVSFQTPQHIDPGNSAAVVASHEQEHVVRNQAKAESEGGRVVSSSVTLHGDICPECGRYYIAGGTTRTVTKHGEQENPAELSAKLLEGMGMSGGGEDGEPQDEGMAVTA